jgi:flagellar basal-body rod protein FlgG
MRALYTAATGMAADQLKIENIANNIANANTTGFKKVREGFADLVYQQIGSTNAGGDPMQVGSGVRVAGLSRDFRAGDIVMSSSPTDMLIDGNGFFVVESPTGELLYTRDGHFRTDFEGNLVTQNGYRVSPGIQLPEGGRLVVGGDGTVTAEIDTTAGTESVALGNLELATFPNPAGLEAAGGNFFRATTASGEAVVSIPLEEGVGGILQYATERSNVDVAEELIAMITAQRGYELSSKVIQAADEMLQTTAGLKR